jgi:hypothetical protein
MAAVSSPRPARAPVKQDRRRLAAAQVMRRRTARMPEPWRDEQAELARDLAALIDTGLIVAIDDGPEIRYAAAGGEEVLP